jgi:hypothetical protein
MANFCAAPSVAPTPEPRYGPAFEAFTAMGANAFAERARRELKATGETVRKRGEDQREVPIDLDQRIRGDDGVFGECPDLDTCPRFRPSTV